jgi:hypothetical protein
MPNIFEICRTFVEDYKLELKFVVAGVSGLIIGRSILRYRQAINKRLKQFHDESFLGSSWMVRGEIPEDSKRFFRLLQLNPDFVKANSGNWKFMSLGDYLSSLKPAILPKDVDTPLWIQREMEATLTAILLSTLGPRWGMVLLPTIGSSHVENRLKMFAGSAASYWASHYRPPSHGTNNAVGDTNTGDRGGMQVSLFSMTAFVNINDQIASKPDVSPLEWMCRGEVGYKPTFDQDNLIPNPFVIDQHWDKAIKGMEQLLQSEHKIESKATPNEDPHDRMEPTQNYNPEDKSMPEPRPINDRILPGLHMGWGNATCTHTKREILRNRLFAVLLTRLGYNYYLAEQRSQDATFKVEINGATIVNPGELIQELMNSGHKVTVCPRATVTTFGMAICIKENDGSWTNVPLGYFLQTGYEDKDERPAYCYLPHGGLDLDIEGPLVGVDATGASNKCNIQHYMAIEGMCGWHSNHNASVPWIRPVDCGEKMHGAKAIQAVRMAGLGAIILNAVGTELELPFGGYGLTGVCNDTSALLDQALRGETSVFPLTSTGRFLMHQARRIRALRKNLEGFSNFKAEIRDLDRLADATVNIPSDLHASPSNCADSSRRLLHCLPPDLPFQLMVETKKIMEEIAVESVGFVNERIDHQKHSLLPS